MRINEIINRRTSGHDTQVRRLDGNVVQKATVRSLESICVRAVRATYESLHRDSDDSDSMDDETFLTKVGFFKRGKVTNAALVLLGKASEPLVPSSVCIRWRLIGVDGTEEDSRVMERPLLLAARQVVSMVRNTTVQIGSGGRSTSMYRVASLTEAIFNAIQFQDYESGGMIDVVERERESVTVSNMGSFPTIRRNLRTFPSHECGRQEHVPQEGHGELRSHPGPCPGKGDVLSQAYRHFPLPDFSVTDNRVSVTFPG